MAYDGAGTGWNITAIGPAISDHASAETFGDAEIDALVAKCREVFASKGKDYTLSTGDQLHNFRAAGEFIGMTAEQAWSVYFYKHVSAIFAYAKCGKVASEPIEGRIIDAINYLLLFHKLTLEGRRDGQDQGGAGK